MRKIANSAAKCSSKILKDANTALWFPVKNCHDQAVLVIHASARSFATIQTYLELEWSLVNNRRAQDAGDVGVSLSSKREIPRLLCSQVPNAKSLQQAYLEAGRQRLHEAAISRS
jgi:hypothetical protein